MQTQNTEYPESVDISAISTDGLTTVDKLNLAAELYDKMLEVLREVLDESPNENKEVYVYEHLQILRSEEHGFMSRDINLQDWISEEERQQREEGGGFDDLDLAELDR
jgi:hypothetical protein